MRLLVAPDSTFYKTPDDKYWSKTVYSYQFFERYLNVFDEIIVASRTKNVTYDEVKGFLRADGINMTVAELPAVSGISDYLKSLFSITKAAKKAVVDNVYDCSLIRLPSLPAFFILHYIKKYYKPYALEVVADPEAAYASNKLARIFFSKHLKRTCMSANGVSYVTKEYLQSKYPSYVRIHGEDERHFDSYFSTIQLADDYYGNPKKYVGKKHFKIIHTANNMNNDIKGHLVLIEAFKKLIDKGYDLELTFVGDGTKKTLFENRVKELGINSKVNFTGRLIGGEYVREELVNSDLLVFPTKAEGLPRTIIEAMAVGLPCISTPIAGIPELLDNEDMIDPSDVIGFSNRIEYFINNPEVMEKKSARNIQISLNYRNDVLTKRRNDFYKKLKNLTFDK